MVDNVQSPRLKLHVSIDDAFGNLKGPASLAGPKQDRSGLNPREAIFAALGFDPKTKTLENDTRTKLTVHMGEVKDRMGQLSHSKEDRETRGAAVVAMTSPHFLDQLYGEHGNRNYFDRRLQIFGDGHENLAKTFRLAFKQSAPRAYEKLSFSDLGFNPVRGLVGNVQEHLPEKLQHLDSHEANNTIPVEDRKNLIRNLVRYVSNHHLGHKMLTDRPMYDHQTGEIYDKNAHVLLHGLVIENLRILDRQDKVGSAKALVEELRTELAEDARSKTAERDQLNKTMNARTKKEGPRGFFDPHPEIYDYNRLGDLVHNRETVSSQLQGILAKHEKEPVEQEEAPIAVKKEKAKSTIFRNRYFSKYQSPLDKKEERDAKAAGELEKLMPDVPKTTLNSEKQEDNFQVKPHETLRESFDEKKPQGILE